MAACGSYMYSVLVHQSHHRPHGSKSTCISCIPGPSKGCPVWKPRPVVWGSPARTPRLEGPACHGRLVLCNSSNSSRLLNIRSAWDDPSICSAPSGTLDRSVRPCARDLAEEGEGTSEECQDTDCKGDMEGSLVFLLKEVYMICEKRFSWRIIFLIQSCSPSVPELITIRQVLL